MSDAKIIKCNKECLNWDESLNDCKFGHDVYQSRFGILYVPADCPDFEPMGDEIDEFLEGFGDGGYEDEEPYEEEYYEEEYEEPVRETRTRRPIREERKPVREKTDFRERTRQKIEEARRAKREMRPPVQKENKVKEYDPMDELRADAAKSKSSVLGELQAFKEQVESGLITPEQIQKDIESMNGKNVEVPEISEQELEEVRRKAGVASKNSKIKKPEKKSKK